MSFQISEISWNESVRNYERQHRRRPLGDSQVPILFIKTCMGTTQRNAVTVFESRGPCPQRRNVIPELNLFQVKYQRTW